MSINPILQLCLVCHVKMFDVNTLHLARNLGDNEEDLENHSRPVRSRSERSHPVQWKGSFGYVVQ
jgi:hypothetical protein